MNNPVAVFLRRDFTSHTLHILSEKYNEYLDYVVIDTHMFMSLSENIHLFFSRENRKYNCDDIFLTELHRILPYLRISKVVVDGDLYRNLSIKHAIEHKKI